MLNPFFISRSLWHSRQILINSIPSITFVTELIYQIDTRKSIQHVLIRIALIKFGYYKYDFSRLLQTSSELKLAEFPYKKAAYILAYAQLFGKRSACDRYQIKSGTYDGWKNKLKKDEVLKQLYLQELDKLFSEWQGETVRALKRGLEVAYQGFDTHPFEKKPENIKEQLAWAKTMDATGRVIRAIGELAIGTHVLMEEDDEEGEED